MLGPRAVDALARLGREQYLLLPGVGRLEVTTFPAHRGRNPITGEPVDVLERRLPLFELAPELRAELAGGAVEPDSSPAGIDEVRDDAADALAADVRARLLTHGLADVEGFGSFEVRAPRGPKTVTFRAAPELLSALNRGGVQAK